MQLLSTSTGAGVAQLIYYVLVMDDFLADLNRRAGKIEADFSDVEGAPRPRRNGAA